MIKETENPLPIWFFVHSGQRVGPVDESEVVKRIRRDEIEKVTLVWKKGMGHWKPAGETELLRHFPTDAPPPIPDTDRRHPETGGRRSVASEEEKLNQLWKWWTIVFPISIGFCVVGSFAYPVFFIGLVPTIGAIVIWCFMLYKFWAAIQDGEARTTPDKAVGFMFIPFFNYYWGFVAILGLAKDMNQYCKRRSINAPIIDESYAKALCICLCASVVSVIPFVGALYYVVFGVLSFRVWKPVMESCVAILKTRSQDIG